MRRRQFIALGAASGLMAATAGRAQPAPRIVMFGDSLTEGFGLPPAQALVAQLQEWLAARGTPAQIVNAGLSGDTTYGGRVRIGWSLRDASHDAVIVELGGNDLLMGFPLREIERNLDAIIRRAKRGNVPVLLVGIMPPQSAIKAARPDVAAMWQRVAARHQVILLPDLYAPLWRQPARTLPLYVQEDQIHLSAAGIGLVLKDLGPMVAELIGRIKEAGP